MEYQADGIAEADDDGVSIDIPRWRNRGNRFSKEREYV